MTYRDSFDWGFTRQGNMDEVVEDVRAFQETIHGPRYWERPVETTGPKDPHPGHKHDCKIRITDPVVHHQPGFGACTCTEEPDW